MIRRGRIVVPANSSANNTTTAGAPTLGAPFAISATTSAIYLVARATGITYRSARDATASSTLAADVNDFALGANVAFGENIGVSAGGSAPLVVACYNSTGAPVNVDVYQVIS